jgi:CcmD family protein
MKMRIAMLASILLSMISNVFAQNNMPPNPNENIDLLRQNGQIYLVVLVLVTIFAGIIFMLVRIERKLNKMESVRDNPNK